MSEPRAGAWMTARPAAVGRWVSRLRGAELPADVTVQWLAVYAALFLPARAARRHALLITLGCLARADDHLYEAKAARRASLVGVSSALA
jgi:hypothetical protein